MMALPVIMAVAVAIELAATRSVVSDWTIAFLHMMNCILPWPFHLDHTKSSVFHGRWDWATHDLDDSLYEACELCALQRGSPGGGKASAVAAKDGLRKCRFCRTSLS